jgi:hypothetical protein
LPATPRLVADVALEREIARLSKILVDSIGITFEEAQARLRALTLEVVIGYDAGSPAAHAATLTAVSTGRRSFLGGVRVTGQVSQPVITALPYCGMTLGEVCAALGAASFEGEPSFRIFIGGDESGDRRPSATAVWDAWTAGVRSPGERGSVAVDGSNPLAGVAAGGLAVATAFDHARGKNGSLPADIHLWDPDQGTPAFADVFLPGALWIVGLGNLGQAFLWSLACLPYQDPGDLLLFIQDFDRVTPENWGTSVLVVEEAYGWLKNKSAEAWLEQRGFGVRRIDRRLRAAERLGPGEPSLAFSGVDKVAARRDMANVGFEVIVDAGLGRTAANFDKFGVNVFHAGRRIDDHYAGMSDPIAEPIPPGAAYEELVASIGQCGAAEVAGASVAAPHVSAVAGAIAVARTIALVSGCKVPPSEVRRLSAGGSRRAATSVAINAPSLIHAGKPAALG